MAQQKDSAAAAQKYRQQEASKPPAGHAGAPALPAPASKPYLFSSHCEHVHRLPFCGARRRRPPRAATAAKAVPAGTGQPDSRLRCCSSTAQGRAEVPACL